MNPINDVIPAGSSPADASAASSPAGQVEQTPAENSAAQEGQFDTAIDALEAGKGPIQAAEESAAAPETPEAKQDEPGAGQGEAADVSQNQTPEQKQAEEQLTKAFNERPEWKSALELVPKAAQPKMREAMRSVLKRENEVLQQIEQTRPAVQKFDRLKRAVGDDQALEGLLQLAELVQRADPKAEEMLNLLLNDVRTRSGSVLASTDLKDQGKEIDDLLAANVIDATEAKRRIDGLLEIEKARLVVKSGEQRKQQESEAQVRQRFETQQADLNKVCSDWDTDKLSSDADYESLKEIVESRAFTVGAEMQRQLREKGQQRLLNGTEMKKVLDDSLEWAKERIGKLSPKPKARTPFNGGSGSSATRRREPANEAEEFNQEIESLEAKRR